MVDGLNDWTYQSLLLDSSPAAHTQRLRSPSRKFALASGARPTKLSAAANYPDHAAEANKSSTRAAHVREQDVVIGPDASIVLPAPVEGRRLRGELARNRQGGYAREEMPSTRGRLHGVQRRDGA